MRSTFDELARELAELRALVDSITPVNSALAGHKDSLVRQYLTIRRRFDYAAFVVALYASFEKFAENLVAAYARIIALRSQYAALPTGLTRKHMVESAELLLAHRRLGEGRYVGVRDLDVVKNLFDCISGATPYALNNVAVVAHALNLRCDELDRLFAAVGIDQVSGGARRADAMVNWWCWSNGLVDPPQDGVPAATVKRLDDLVERRNQVTHRGGNPVELLGTSEMTDLVNFVEALAKSIFALTVAKYLRGRHVESGEAGQLQLREGPYKDGTVVVVEKPDQRLYVGQPIFAFVKTAGVRWGRILDLQVNDVSSTTIETTATATDVGVAVDFKCAPGVELFVLDADDDVVWSLSPVTPATTVTAVDT